MPEFYNCLVFQPNCETTTYEYIQLRKKLPYMHFVNHPPGCGRVACLFFSAFQLRRLYSSNTLAGGGGGDTAAHAAPAESPARFLILYSHGNGEDIGECYDLLRMLSMSLCVDVLCYDYRGYGFSGHSDSPFGSFSPTETSVLEDADLVYEHALRLGYHPSRIVIMGRSLGGGPAAHLARQHHQEVAGLILESAFTSCLSVGCLALPVLACLDMFNNKACMRQATGCPVLFMHGDRDAVVPFRCSGDLMRATLAARRAALHEVNRAVRRAPPAPPAACDPTEAAASCDEDGRAATLAAFGLRPYSKGSQARTPEERELGVFFQWFAGCGHNNLESSQGQLYYDTIERFLLCVAQTAPAEAGDAVSAGGQHAVL